MNQSLILILRTSAARSPGLSSHFALCGSGVTVPRELSNAAAPECGQPVRLYESNGMGVCGSVLRVDAYPVADATRRSSKVRRAALGSDLIVSDSVKSVPAADNICLARFVRVFLY